MGKIPERRPRFLSRTNGRSPTRTLPQTASSSSLRPSSLPVAAAALPSSLRRPHSPNDPTPSSIQLPFNPFHAMSMLSVKALLPPPPTSVRIDLAPPHRHLLLLLLLPLLPLPPLVGPFQIPLLLQPLGNFRIPNQSSSLMPDLKSDLLRSMVFPRGGGRTVRRRFRRPFDVFVRGLVSIRFRSYCYCAWCLGWCSEGRPGREGAQEAFLLEVRADGGEVRGGSERGELRELKGFRWSRRRGRGRTRSKAGGHPALERTSEGGREGEVEGRRRK
ncbi:hypothetical protein BDY24DRAFT_395599 [Mrakia frigida]|uniref:uncharacterized protein n=1 Tax=Mrakia frigida TaxID=29902 RepID=UPI003FCBEEED